MLGSAAGLQKTNGQSSYSVPPLSLSSSSSLPSSSSSSSPPPSSCSSPSSDSSSPSVGISASSAFSVNRVLHSSAIASVGNLARRELHAESASPYFLSFKQFIRTSCMDILDPASSSSAAMVFVCLPRDFKSQLKMTGQAPACVAIKSLRYGQTD